jgi:hypothetical protein
MFKRMRRSTLLYVRVLKYFADPAVVAATFDATSAAELGNYANAKEAVEGV